MSRAIHEAPSIMLLDAEDPVPVVAENSGSAAPFVFVCDHAGRAVPRALNRLGLPEAAFETHIAWDIGALDLASRLASSLDACLIHQRYSRLVIDCNRDPAHPGSVVDQSDGWIVPGNRGLSSAAREARRREIFQPYHDRVAGEIDARAARGLSTVLVCVHSFTPVLSGAARPWHVGVLHMNDSPASTAMLTLLRQESGLVVGDNEPYAMDGVDYTAPRHGRGAGRDMLELEFRQDLLQSPTDLEGMSARLGGLLTRLL